VLGHHLVEQGDQQGLLALEVEVDGSVGHVGAARDLRDLGGEIALAREHLHRRLQDALALVVSSPPRHE